MATSPFINVQTEQLKKKNARRKLLEQSKQLIRQINIQGGPVVTSD